jgi:YVTN family beta-propeller protein
VANYGSNSISIINGTTNTLIDNITVGNQPNYVCIYNNNVYVANLNSNSISIINGTTNTLIDNITVGNQPYQIYPNQFTKTIYVTNYASNSISIINGTTNAFIKNIAIGNQPYYVISDGRDAIFVSNQGSDSISVIDAIDNKVVTWVIFDVNPIKSGKIVCNETSFPAPTEQYLYVDSGDDCMAIPNKGFEFLSWEENLNGNATQLLTISKNAGPIESFLDLINLNPAEPESTLKITKFGSYTANFKELPPPLPAEYWATLFSFILTTGLGVWLIPSLVRWTRTRADTKKSDYYYQKIKSLYNDGSLDENDLKDLDKLKIDITDAHSKGKINELHYNNFKNEISVLYEEIFKKRIKSLSSNNDQLEEIKSRIKDAYSKGKLTELHYKLLNEEIYQNEKDAIK